MSDYVKRNYDTVRCEIERVAQRVGVNPPSLVAVTKSATDDEVLALLSAGALHIAENRPQMLAARHALAHSAGFSPLCHQIGNLQRNKVKTVLPIASLIHSVDSVKLAAEINRLASRDGMRASVLIEVNSAREAAKGGVMPEEVPSFLNELRAFASIEVLGVMTMGPANATGEELRPYFRATKRLFDEAAARGDFHTDVPVLSMGMSDSYREAIEEGSTLVRIGRRLFLR